MSVGTTVFGGMIAATTLNLVFIPVLYVIVRSIVPGRETQSVAHATELHPVPVPLRL
jgi:HAE1 family hydrophobic/amphiphilic exporter-1